MNSMKKLHVKIKQKEKADDSNFTVLSLKTDVGKKRVGSKRCSFIFEFLQQIVGILVTCSYLWETVGVSKLIFWKSVLRKIEFFFLRSIETDQGISFFFFSFNRCIFFSFHIQVLIYQIHSKKLLRNFQLNYIWSAPLYLKFSFSVFTFIESFLVFFNFIESTRAFNLNNCLFHWILTFVNVFKNG